MQKALRRDWHKKQRDITNVISIYFCRGCFCGLCSWWIGGDAWPLGVSLTHLRGQGYELYVLGALLSPIEFFARFIPCEFTVCSILYNDSCSFVPLLAIVQADTVRLN